MDPLTQQRLNELLDWFDDVAFTVTQKVVALFKAQLDQDLTSDQHLTLRYIKKNSPCTSSKLAEAFYVNRSAITAIVNRLSNKGYIVRIPDESDRRVILLELTPDGERVLANGEEKILQALDHYLCQLEEEELATMMRTFAKLATIIRDEEVADRAVEPKATKNSVSENDGSENVVPAQSADNAQEGDPDETLT
ncbi:MarR family winged helix-turn-helix transcriptional regulator [Numidum massiliense]|uniref:MarR family winged helix-turn-helix transcriptional regulator n=1 Tax=Numidum massiliense TaxID=1522315 RepID=UPI0006D58B5A|nr:MarR family transcriptional regulator [Numidum massiliense]